MKRSYIAVHDYGMGTIVRRIFARELSEVASLLRKPTWSVWEEEDPDRPRFEGEKNILESDIDSKAPWFLHQIRNQDQVAPCKDLFFFSYSKAGVEHYMAIYARNEQEVLDRFGTLCSMVGKPVPGSILRNIAYYYIDRPHELPID